MMEVVEKRIGLGTQGKRLKVGANYPISGIPQQTMSQFMSSNNLLAMTHYIYINKEVAEQLHNNGTLDNTHFESMKSGLAGMGIQWNSLPNQYEHFQIGDIGVWNYSSTP